MDKRSALERFAVGLGKAIIPPFIKDKVRRVYYLSRYGKLEDEIVQQEIKEKSYHTWYRDMQDKQSDVINITDDILESGNHDTMLMRKLGMKPENTLFEFGVGYLRSSNHFVEYLNEGNFAGCDASSKRIAKGKSLNPIHDRKKSKLIVSPDNSCDWLEGKKYDYIWSNAVFCHMPLEDIKDTFINIRDKVMHDDSVFATTYSVLEFEHFSGFSQYPENERVQRMKEEFFDKKRQFVLWEQLQKIQGSEMGTFGPSNWFHSKAFFEKFAQDCGFETEDVTHLIGDMPDTSYNPWTRVLKMTLKK